MTTKVLARSMICATRESVRVHPSIVQIQIRAHKIRATRFLDVFRRPHQTDQSAQTETPVQSMTIVRIQNASPDRKRIATTTVFVRVIRAML